VAVGGGSGRTKIFSVFGWGAGKAEIVRFLLSLWPLPDPPSGDLDGDGVVGASDLGVMLANWDC